MRVKQLLSRWFTSPEAKPRAPVTQNDEPIASEVLAYRVAQVKKLHPELKLWAETHCAWPGCKVKADYAPGWPRPYCPEHLMEMRRGKGEY